MKVLQAFLIAACSLLWPTWGAAAPDQDDPPIYSPQEIGRPKTSSSSGGTNRSEAPLQWEDAMYVRPNLGSPQTPTTGATRGTNGAPPELFAPRDHIGLTASAQPTLYWRLPQTTSEPVVIVVQERGAVQTLVNKQLGSPQEAGVHAVDLRQFEVSLQPDVDYKWSIRVVTNPEKPSADPVAEAWIRRTNLTAAVLEQIEKTAPHRKVNVLAEKSIWYDAIDAVSRQIDAHAGDPGPVRQRDSLLMQLEPAHADAPRAR